jgi:hypothetical protein
MTPSDVAFLKAIIAFGLLAVTGLTGWWLRLRGRALPDAGLRDEIEALRHEVELLRAEADARLPELEERVDFVERALVDPARAPRLERKHPTPV